jgi:hypothetical protein
MHCLTYIYIYHHRHHHWPNNNFLATAFLRRCCQISLFPTMCRESDNLLFTCFGFVNNFFTRQGHQPFVQPPTWSIMSLYLCSSVTGWTGNKLRYMVPFPLSSTTRRDIRWTYSNQPSPGGVKNSLLHVVQTGCGVHLTSYPMATGGSFSRDKAAVA